MNIWNFAIGQDTVYLVNQKILTGKFISMQCLNIKFFTNNKARLIPLNKIDKVIYNGRQISLINPCPENVTNAEYKTKFIDSTKGMILFECYMCAEKGKLIFVSKTDKIKTESNFTFLTNEAPFLYRHRQALNSGEYNWFYSDEYNMKTKGVIYVVPGKEQKIVLFENKEN